MVVRQEESKEKEDCCVMSRFVCSGEGSEQRDGQAEAFANVEVSSSEMDAER